MDCRPWDLLCALQDQFGSFADDTNLLDNFPLIKKMQKTSLTTEDANEIDEYAKLYYGDYWSRGLFNAEDLTVLERD